METAAEYAAAVRQQLLDATELLDHPTVNAYEPDAHDRHAAGVMYLAGYAVEAAVKSYLIRKLQGTGKWRPGFEPTLDDIRDLPGVSLPRNLHSLSALWEASGLAGRDDEMDVKLHACSVWRPTWRYRPPSGRARHDAESFYHAAKALALWILQQT